MKNCPLVIPTTAAEDCPPGPLRKNIGQAPRIVAVLSTAWLGAAALLGMMCCAVSLVDVALTLTLDGTDVASHQEKAAAIRGLEKTHRDLMRTIVTQSTGALTAPRGESRRRMRGLVSPPCSRTSAAIASFSPPMAPAFCRFARDAAIS